MNRDFSRGTRAFGRRILHIGQTIRDSRPEKLLIALR
jgi:hypothetical protein